MVTRRDRAWCYDHLAEYVQRLLATRSLRQMAVRTGLDKTTIMHVAQGREPKLSTAKAIIDGYGR